MSTFFGRSTTLYFGMLLTGIIFLQQPVLAQKKSSDPMHTTQEKQTLSKTDFLQWLKTLKAKDGISGSDIVLQHFPDTWAVPGYHEKAIPNPNTQKVDSLNSLMYQDYDNATRSTFIPDKALREQLITPAIQKALELGPVQDTAVFKILKLKSDPASELYSVITTGEVPCTRCDNSKHQFINVLVSIHKNDIADLLVIAYEYGDDVSKQMRYYYIDTQGHIFLKDFTIEELSISYNAEEQWRVEAGGHFKK